MNNRQIEKSLDKSMIEKRNLFEFIDKLDQETLVRKKSEDVWNVMQVLLHLKEAESGALLYMKKKHSVIDQVKSCNWKSSRNSILLQISLSLPLRFKAPNLISNPEVTQDYESLKHDYLALDDQLREMFSDFPQSYMNKAIFKHPFVGKLNILQTLKFQRAHLSHHKQQIKRILRQLK